MTSINKTNIRVINIVDNVTKVNFGIWNAAVATAQALKETHGIITELWGPPIEQNPESQHFTFVPVPDTSSAGLQKLIAERKLDPTRDIIITHGTWRYSTKWGAALAKKKYQWIAVPHGMLRYWCIKIKGWKKYPFFWLSERPNTRLAAAIRAVSAPEEAELLEQFAGHKCIFRQPNCTTLPAHPLQKDASPRIVLFMARIHEGKRVVQLAKAWSQSKLNRHPDFQLLIAGPDDGELPSLKAFIDTQTDGNITYVGPQYGTEKAALLSRASYYVLPSVAESFPSSVIEALSYGLVSLITEHCNFPEVFEEGIALKIGTEINEIQQGLDQLIAITPQQWGDLSERGVELVRRGYSDTGIAAQQAAMFHKMLGVT